MKNEDLKDRLLQNKDDKALEDDVLSNVSGGWDGSVGFHCKTCGCDFSSNPGQRSFGICPHCGSTCI